jgi:hypothetical protein
MNSAKSTHQHASISPLLCNTFPDSHPQYPPLSQVTKPNVTTAHAAYLLSRQEQTLRGWACNENGPLLPIRISGRLAWPVSELQRVLSGGAE